MNSNELASVQELADSTQAHIASAINGMTKLQHVACDQSKTNPEAEATTALTAKALGYLWLAHGEATAAATAMPDIAPRFGDK